MCIPNNINFLKETMIRILKFHPDLTYGGFVIGDYRKIGREERDAETARERDKMLTPDSLDQFKRCYDWLARQPRTRKVHPKSGNSYCLKEEVEQDGQHVSSGMFIAAAIACGYTIAQAGYNSRHAWLNIGQLRETNPNLHLLTSRSFAPPSTREERFSRPGSRWG